MNREDAFFDRVKAFRIVKYLLREANYAEQGQNDDLFAKSPMGVFNRRHAESEYRKRLLAELKCELAERGSAYVIVRGSTFEEDRVEVIA